MVEVIYRGDTKKDIHFQVDKEMGPAYSVWLASEQPMLLLPFDEIPQIRQQKQLISHKKPKFSQITPMTKISFWVVIKPWKWTC